MCELFGASAATKRNFSRWLVPFRSRGGETADNPDGWGLAHWKDAQPSIEKYPEPGWQSARFLELAHNLNSKLVLAHVRKATHPLTLGLHNTHPFVHACCDREWVFAHNGMVPQIANWPCASSVCHPEGETDSETAFCHVLASIAGDYDTTDHSRWLARLSAVAEAIAATGKFNFLLSDNRFLIAYGHDHLYYLDHDDGQHRYALVSTEPLTDEDWCCFSAGELRVYRDGALFANHVPPRIFQDANKIADLSRVLS
jgi:predicted glutamine amidotransferase